MLSSTPGARRTDVREMVTVVAARAADGPGRSHLAELKVVEGEYPFYGRLETDAAAARAEGELERLGAALDAAYPGPEGRRRELGLEPATWIDPTARVAERDNVRLMVVAAGVLVIIGTLVGIALARRRNIG